MTGPERGFALLCSHLGNPERKPMTAAQLRTLSQRVRSHDAPEDVRELQCSDLTALGYGPEEARRIVGLLEEEFLLDRYLEKAARQSCHLLTRLSPAYPARLRQRLGDDTPGCLWYKGDPDLLSQPAIALVGSRELLPENRVFALEAGFQAARQGYVLVSGNARGADRTAQDACLCAGGQVISVTAEPLTRREPEEHQLFLCEDGFDTEFSVLRALRRNRVIHALGYATLVAQSGLEKGGTWDGTARNLRHGWSPVCCFDDGSLSADALEQLGARLIATEALSDLAQLLHRTDRLF